MAKKPEKNTKKSPTRHYNKNSKKLFGIGDQDLKMPNLKMPEVKPIPISQKTKKITLAIALFIATIIIVLGPFGNAGEFGLGLADRLYRTFGIAYPLLPILLSMWGARLLGKRSIRLKILPTIFCLLTLISFLGLISIVASGTNYGGNLGLLVANPLHTYIGIIAGGVFLAAVLICSILVLSDTGHIQLPFSNSEFDMSSFSFRWPWKKYEDDDTLDPEDLLGQNDEEENSIEEIPTVVPKSSGVQDEINSILSPKAVFKVTGMETIGTDDFEIRAHKRTTYVPPPLGLLETDKGKPNVGDIKANSNIIKRTLANFGIDVEMDEVTIGPTVTRYALKPAQGVKLTRILTLQQDLSLALAAHPLRIEAPIPGKSLVGIEIPNKIKSTVGLASLFSDAQFAEGKKPLLLAMGRGLSGKSLVADLAKMPHALIAGTTGSGKSVSIHTIINSLIYRNGPESLRFIFIDPKRVELTLYNGIPHLLSPVITQPKKAIMALKWAHKEMDRRYDILEASHVRDIESYHNTISKKAGGEAMPYIVIVIDELADLMHAYPRELEAAIVRLAQMSRAVGIHLVLSTQRPSVEVITGLIKANIPTRVALQVASQIDSRTIIDQPGAEKLLGRGDMLYLSSDAPQPERLQSAYISEDEVKSVVSYLIEAYKDEIPDEVNFAGVSQNSAGDIFSSTIDGSDDGDDDMYELAKEAVMEAGKASTSYLQRKLKLGYARAARLMDMLESKGVIGPGEGAKAREVYGANNAKIDEEPTYE